MNLEKQPSAPTADGTMANVEATLANYCKHQIEAAEIIAPDYVRLWKTVSDYIDGGGKRLRPRLVCLAYKASGGQYEDEAVTVAAAWELLHSCLLIHDDIIDRDDTRHGKPNVAGVYRSFYDSITDKTTANHLANSAALLAGDIALASAYDLILQSHIRPESKLKATKRLGPTIHQVAGGQLLDTEAILYPPLTVATEKIGLYKTAGYSFVGPLLAGAELANSSEQDMEALENYGQAVGIGYQLADDLLGVFGDSDKTGKSTNSDIREGKRTLLVQLALKALPHEVANQLMEILDGNSEQFETARDLIEQSGARQQIENRIERCYEQAARAIIRLSWSQDDKQELLDLAAYSLKRSY